MHIFIKTTLLSFLILSLTACAHMERHYAQKCSLPIHPIENQDLKITIVNGVPVAELDGKVISERVDFPEELVPDADNQSRAVSLRSIEQFTLVKIKGSCYYFVCVGSTCSKFEVPDYYCN